MRTLGWLALAGAGLGYLFGTDHGRRAKARAGSYLADCYNQARDWYASRNFQQMVEEHATGDDVPDTSMAQAFQEAVTA